MISKNEPIGCTVGSVPNALSVTGVCNVSTHNAGNGLCVQRSHITPWNVCSGICRVCWGGAIAAVKAGYTRRWLAVRSFHQHTTTVSAPLGAHIPSREHCPSGHARQCGKQRSKHRSFSRVSNLVCEPVSRCLFQNANTEKRMVTLLATWLVIFGVMGLSLRKGLSSEQSEAHCSESVGFDHAEIPSGSVNVGAWLLKGSH